MTEAAAQALKVWYDTEFIENGVTIDLISIGMVTEDGRELYLINRECDWSKASDWVRENVIAQLRPTTENFVTHREIRDRVLAFLGWRTERELHEEAAGYGLDTAFFTFSNIDPDLLVKPAHKLELWGYYSAYDHVVFCQLFGTMMNLPKGMPMYTRDLKQWCAQLGDPPLPEQGKGEHDALADARWNREAHRFLTDHAEQQRRARNAHLWSIATGQGETASPPEEPLHIYADSRQTALHVIKDHGLDPQRCEIYTSLEKLRGREVPRLHLVGPWPSHEVMAELQRPGRELVHGL